MVDKMCREVAVTHKGRDWPNAAQFVASIPKAPSLPSADDDEMGWKLAWARELWFRGTREVPPKTCIAPANTWKIAKALIAEGADPWELRYGGFETETEYFRELERKGQGWSGHEAKMAELRALRERLSGNM